MRQAMKLKRNTLKKRRETNTRAAFEAAIIHQTPFQYRGMNRARTHTHSLLFWKQLFLLRLRIGSLTWARSNHRQLSVPLTSMPSCMGIEAIVNMDLARKSNGLMKDQWVSWPTFLCIYLDALLRRFFLTKDSIPFWRVSFSLMISRREEVEMRGSQTQIFVIVK